MGMKASLFRKLPPFVKQEMRRWRYGKLINRNPELLGNLSDYRSMMIHGSHNGFLVPTEEMDCLAKPGLEVCEGHQETIKPSGSVKEL